MRYWSLALLLCASSVGAQNLDKTVDVQVQDAPKNPTKLLQTDVGNGANIQGAKLSPDGKLVALYGVDSGDPNLPNRKTRGVLQIWDLASRQKVRDLVGHQEWMQRVFWSHDGQKLASQSQDGQILLWDATSGKQSFALTAANKMASFPPQGTPTEQLQQLTAMFERPQLVGFAPDDLQIYAIGAHLVLPAGVQTALFTTLQDAQEAKNKAVREKVEKPIVNFTDYLLGNLRGWDARSGKAIVNKDFGAPGRYRLSSTLSADGHSFLVSDVLLKNGAIVASKLEKRDLKSGALQIALDGGVAKDDKPNLFSRLSDDGRFALLSSSGEDNHSAQLWDINARTSLQVLADSNADFGRAFFVAGNSKLLVAGRLGDILIFDVASAKLERHLSGGHWGEISTLDLTPDGKTLMSVGDQDSAVQLWDLTKPAGTSVQARALVRDYNSFPSFAPDGSFWSSYNNADWDSKDASLRTGKSLDISHFDAAGKEIEKISFPEELLVDGVIFSPDFKSAAGRLYTTPQPAYQQGAGIGVWDLEQKKLLWHLPGNKYLDGELVFSPDGKTLISGRNDGVVQLWNIESGELVRQLFKTRAGHRISSLALTADGKTLAIGSDSGTIQLLDMETDEVDDEITEDFTPSSIKISPDGKYVLSGGNIEIDNNPVGFKVALRDAQTKTLIREWSHDKGEAENRGELLYQGQDDGGRYFGGLAFSPDSQLLAFSHYGNLMRIDRAQTEIWDIASNMRVGVIPDRASAQAPMFSLDGKSVLTTDSNWIKSWDLNEVLAHNAKP